MYIEANIETDRVTGTVLCTLHNVPPQYVYKYMANNWS